MVRPSPTHTTISGRPIEALYRPEAVADLDYSRDLGDPGDFPYTRGIHRTMYRGKAWTMRQFAGFGTPRETNARFKYLLEHGGHGLPVAFFPPRPSMRVIVDMIRYCTERLPKWNSISISGYHIREAGSTAAQELAFTLRDGIEYVQWCVDAGMDVDEFAPRLSFFFNSHSDFSEEIAKFRAARRLWARTMKERFGAKSPRSWMCRCHAQTAGVSLTAQQPYNNVVRTALQALAAVLGGTQSLHTNSLDEAFALPTEEAATLALRTQQIIAHETGVTNIVDPLGGSYFIEKLTNE